MLQPLGIRIGLFPPEPDTRFPMTVEGLIRTDSLRGGPVSVSYEDVVIDGEPVYQVRVWIGRDASTQDRSAILAVVGSIRLLHGPQ